ncbi:MAG: sulfatase [Candidatus Bathyarchaeia archaeon]
MNLILIIIDSLRADHVGCYGNEWIRTPNMDRLSRESVLFEDAYPEGLPTIPVRRALFTGNRSYPWEEYPLWKGDWIRRRGWHPLRATDITVSEILKEHGYTTALITDAYHIFKPCMNFHRGFDSFQWIRGQEGDSYRTGPLRGVDVGRYVVPALEEGRLHGRTTRSVLERYLKNVEDRRCEEDYFAPRVFRSAMKWLEDNRDQERFFLCVDSFDPHEPWDPPSYYVDLYDPGYEGKEIIFPRGGDSSYLSHPQLRHIRALYAGEVTMVDRWLGLFLDKVGDLGLLENSLIFLISDHGHPLGEHGIIKKRPENLYSELLHIPLMIRHPEGEYAGVRVKGFVQDHDFMPTALSLLGIPLPGEVDGHDLWPLVTGQTEKIRDYVICAYDNYACVLDQRWHYICQPEGEDQRLYELEQDPTSHQNIIEERPDKAKEMRGRLEALLRGSKA